MTSTKTKSPVRSLESSRRFTPTDKLAIRLQRLAGWSLTEIANHHNTTTHTVRYITGTFVQCPTQEEHEDALARLKEITLDEVGLAVQREACWEALLSEVRVDQLVGQWVAAKAAEQQGDRR